MSQLTAVPDSTVAEPIETADAAPAADAPEHAEVAIADLLVEEVSIDGMCGVY